MAVNNKVIVFGGNHHNTLGVIRSLGEKGVNSYVLIHDDSRKSFVLKSKYIIKGWIFPTADSCIRKILMELPAELNKSIIFCTSDDATYAIDKNFHVLRDRFYLPLCKTAGATTVLMDKKHILKLAAEHSINIPLSWEIIDRIIPNGIRYPCITKPLMSVHGCKADIAICQDEQELRHIVLSNSHCKDYIIQEYIEKEKEISILGAVLYNGDVVYSGCIDKLREGSIGSSAFAVMADNKVLGDDKQKLQSLLQDSGYTGLFSVEYLYKNRIFYFLEINFRNDGNGYVPTFTGLNLPYLWYSSCLGMNPTIPDKKNIHFPCYFVVEPTELTGFIKKRISLLNIIRDIKKADCFLLYNKHDKKPFYYQIVQLFLHRISRPFRK